MKDKLIDGAIGKENQTQIVLRRGGGAQTRTTRLSVRYGAICPEFFGNIVDLFWILPSSVLSGKNQDFFNSFRQPLDTSSFLQLDLEILTLFSQLLLTIICIVSFKDSHKSQQNMAHSQLMATPPLPKSFLDLPINVQTQIVSLSVQSLANKTFEFLGRREDTPCG